MKKKFIFFLSFSVPPMESLHCTLNPNLEYIDLIVLYNNPTPVPLDTPVVFETNIMGGRAAKISPCAAIRNFRSFAIYRIASKGKNVLLKYKENGIIEPRRGDLVNAMSVATVTAVNSIFTKLATSLTTTLAKGGINTNLMHNNDHTSMTTQPPQDPNTFDFNTNVTSVECVFRSAS